MKLPSPPLVRFARSAGIMQGLNCLNYLWGLQLGTSGGGSTGFLQFYTLPRLVFDLINLVT